MVFYERRPRKFHSITWHSSYICKTTGKSNQITSSRENQTYARAQPGISRKTRYHLSYTGDPCLFSFSSSYSSPNSPSFVLPFLYPLLSPFFFPFTLLFFIFYTFSYLYLSFTPFPHIPLIIQLVCSSSLLSLCLLFSLSVYSSFISLSSRLSSLS